MRRQRGFTMTELLVVIAIIVVLLGLVSPMVGKAWKQGQRTRTAADLQAIATALEAYRQDHGDYPEVGVAPNDNNLKQFWGGRRLCWTLVAPGTKDQDGAQGPGFRTRRSPPPANEPQGRVFGPYLQPDQFKIDAPPPGSPPASTGDARNIYLALLDRHSRPILYYRALAKPNIRRPGGFVDDWTPGDPSRPLYNAQDNPRLNDGMSKGMLGIMLGDTNANGMIDPDETPAYEGPYLLWSAGPDEEFGVASVIAGAKDPTQIRRAVERCDDVTNFRQ